MENWSHRKWPVNERTRQTQHFESIRTAGFSTTNKLWEMRGQVKIYDHLSHKFDLFQSQLSSQGIWVKPCQIHSCRCKILMAFRTPGVLWRNLAVVLWFVVWNIFYFFHILGIIISPGFHIFQRGRYTTNQYWYSLVGSFNDVSSSFRTWTSFSSMSFICRKEFEWPVVPKNVGSSPLIFLYIYYIYNTHLCQLIGFDFHIIYIYIYLYICIDRFALQKYVVGVCVYCSISPCIFDIYIYIYIYVQYIQLYIYIYVHTHIHHVFWSFLMPGPGQFFEKLDKNHSGFLTWQAH